MSDESVEGDVVVEQRALNAEYCVQFVSVGVVIPGTMSNKSVECEEAFAWLQSTTAVRIGSIKETPVKNRVEIVGQSLPFIDEEEAYCRRITTKAFYSRVPIFKINGKVVVDFIAGINKGTVPLNRSCLGRNVGIPKSATL